MRYITAIFRHLGRGQVLWNQLSGKYQFLTWILASLSCVSATPPMIFLGNLFNYALGLPPDIIPQPFGLLYALVFLVLWTVMWIITYHGFVAIYMKFEGRTNREITDFVAARAIPISWTASDV